MSNNSGEILKWIEIPVLNIERAFEFYSKILSTETVDIFDFGGLRMVYLSKNTSLIHVMLVQGEGRQPNQTGVLPYFDLIFKKNLENAILIAQGCGGGVQVPLFDSGKWGYISYIIDTEGNKIGLTAQYEDSIPLQSQNQNGTTINNTVNFDGFLETPPKLSLSI